MKISNGIKLLGKVTILISIILIFSYVNTLRSKVKRSKEGFEKYTDKLKNNKNVKKTEKYFDGNCKLPISIPFYFVLWLIKMFLWVMGWIFKQFFSEWFNEKFGEFYRLYIVSMGFCIKIYETLFKFLGTIVYKIIWLLGKILSILSKIFFWPLPKILRDAIAGILSIPLIILGPIIDGFYGLYYYSTILCWSEEGIKNDFINWYEEKILLK